MTDAAEGSGSAGKGKEYPCLIRATDGKKVKISTLVSCSLCLVPVLFFPFL
jgi:hypothetical protein